MGQGIVLPARAKPTPPPPPPKYARADVPVFEFAELLDPVSPVIGAAGRTGFDAFAAFHWQSAASLAFVHAVEQLRTHVLAAVCEADLTLNTALRDALTASLPPELLTLMREYAAVGAVLRPWARSRSTSCRVSCRRTARVSR
jgi:hypothetical protein